MIDVRRSLMKSALGGLPLAMAGAIALGSTSASAQLIKSTYNYAEALQKSLFFYEAQQSGRLSPNNRVAWRGNACLTDGQDIGRDLAGGWYDAGDKWTANITMAWSAMALAMSADLYPQAYTQSGQMDELLESLIHVNDYFRRCVLNPEVLDPADLDVVIGCGGKEGVPDPNVHSILAAAEVFHLRTNRPTFRVNRQVPGGDIPAAMAAAMAASAIVIRDNANVLIGKPGFESFNAEAFANELVTKAEKLVNYARLHMSVAENQGYSLRSDGQVVQVGYRTSLVPDKVFTAASWLFMARSRQGQLLEAQSWRTLAFSVYNNEYTQAGLTDWWRDNAWNNFGKLGAFNLIRIEPGFAAAHWELAYYATKFLIYPKTPGGLRLRDPSWMVWGSNRHANNAAMIALYYSDWVHLAPATFPGDTSWLGGRTLAQLKPLWQQEAQTQVNYVLGSNPYGRSYMVGFGNLPFNHVQHGGAYGAWASFEHWIVGKPEYRPETNRHIIYGAMAGGPDEKDVFTQQRTDTTYTFRRTVAPTGLVTKNRSGYVFDPNDTPIQLSSNSQFNEVAIDYNTSINVNLAFLAAKGLGTGIALPDTQFPPAITRNENNDLITTDREYFVSARLVRSAAPCEIEFRLWNRSRWPSQVKDQLSFRLTFRPAFSPRPVTLLNNSAARMRRGEDRKGFNRYIEVGFPGVAIFPGNRWPTEDDFERVTVRFAEPFTSIRGEGYLSGIATTERLVPGIGVYERIKILGGTPVR